MLHYEFLIVGHDNTLWVCDMCQKGHTAADVLNRCVQQNNNTSSTRRSKGNFQHMFVSLINKSKQMTFSPRELY
jgi:hypothetical protein